MMENLKRKIQSLNRERFLFWATFGLIILLGAYLRLYRHDDFLHFELDQARDAMIISDAIEDGPGKLPLLGPRAAGTMLRLGPAFYYLEYLSALIFGNTPPAMNAIGVFLSIATIPLIYIFSSFYFRKFTSLAITAIFSASLFAVVHSKFAWNPNLLPFFILILLISLLKILSFKDYSPWFIYLGAASLAISIQLHFMAFIVLPVLIVLFLFLAWVVIPWVAAKKASIKEAGEKNTKISCKVFFKKNKSKLLHFGAAVLLIIAFNFPVFINDYLTGGANVKEFIKAVTEKSERGERHSLAENFIRNLQEYSNGYFLIISGTENLDVIGVDLFGDKGMVDFKCDRACRDRLFSMSWAGLFFAGGIILFFYNIYFRFKKLNRISDQNKEKDLLKFNFLAINLLLFVIVFVLFLPTAYQFPPRFLLVTLPVAFVITGFWIEAIIKLLNKIYKKIINRENERPKLIAKATVVILVLGLVVLNVHYNVLRFRQQALAHTENPIYFNRDLVLKEEYRLTYLQQMMIVDWIIENSRHQRVYVWGPPKYYRPFLYHLIHQRDKDAKRLRYSVPCLEADYFAVTIARADDDFFQKGALYFKREKTKQFGTFIVHRLEIEDPESVKNKVCLDDKEEDIVDYTKRYTWEEVFEN